MWREQKEDKCKHTELISYKVHKDQFKSLLVPHFQDKKINGYDFYSKGLNLMALAKSKGGHSRASSSMAGTTEDSFGANGGNDSESDCVTTDGEESDPNSPLCPDS
jgi:hypothetical protein